jgi:hypothetical protein
LRFAFAPGAASVALSADGSAIATMNVPAAARAPGTSWFVSLVGWSEDGKAVAGEFDDIEID